MKNKKINPPQLIMAVYMLVLLIVTVMIDMNLADIINDALIKWAMNGVIVLSLIPMINVGAGRNFGMAVGLSAGLLGMVFAVNLRFTSWTGFFSSIAAGSLIAAVLGFFYAKILNQLKMNEEIVGTFVQYHEYFLYICTCDKQTDALSHWGAGT